MCSFIFTVILFSLPGSSLVVFFLHIGKFKSSERRQKNVFMISPSGEWIAWGVSVLCFYRTGDAQTAQVTVWTFIFPPSATSHICDQGCMLTFSIQIFIKPFCLFNPQLLQTVDIQKVYKGVQISLWLPPLPPLLEKWHIYHVTVVNFNWFGSKVYLCWLFTDFVFQIWT